MTEPNFQEAYFGPDGRPTIAFMKLWAEAQAGTTAVETGLATAVVDIAALQASLTAALATIATMQTDITTIQSVNAAQQAEIDANDAKFAAIAAITGPSGGSTIDSEARTAIAAIIAAA